MALLLYWPGLLSWFQKDDFAQLGFRGMVHGWRDFWWVLFAPIAQGTIRTLSERVPFLSFTTIFGIHALPFRCFAFLTFAATLPLLRSVCEKLTGSRAAGFWATVLWTVNSGLAVALSWTAVYYELLWAFFLLLNFWLLLRYIETAQRRFYWAQCATFLAGFGVLELNVVYPALATVYALCCARRIVFQIVPWFAASAAYTAVHLAVAPLPMSGPYKPYWDASMVSTLFTYWKMALGPSQLIWLKVYPSPFRSALTVFLTVGLIGFLTWRLWNRQWVAAFFPAWFVITLAPLLPLRDHINDSYLPAPLIGLAMWGAWSLVTGWKAGVAGKIVVVSLLGIYLCVSVPVTRAITLSFYHRSQEIRRMVLGVVAQGRANPEKLVLLKGVEQEMFWSGVYDRPFRLFGVREVYLLQEEEQQIMRGPQYGDARPFFAEPVVVRNALDRGLALVLDLSGGAIRDITDSYRTSAQIQNSPMAARRLDVGDQLLAGLLGPTWYGNEGGFRWMPKRASVTLSGPRGPAEKLYLTGSCPAAALKPGPLQLQASVDGENLPVVWIRQQDSDFSFAFSLPARLMGRSTMEVTVEVGRTFFAPGDTRELGIAFGVFEIR